MRGLIRQIAAEGTTVFVSSHLLAEVEQVCSHVGVMRTGRLVFQGPLADLRRTGDARVTVRPPNPKRRLKSSPRSGWPGRRPGGRGLGGAGRCSPESVCAELVNRGIGVRGFAVAAPSLEELFVGLTGEGFDVDG